MKHDEIIAALAAVAEETKEPASNDAEESKSKPTANSMQDKMRSRVKIDTGDEEEKKAAS